MKQSDPLSLIEAPHPDLDAAELGPLNRSVIVDINMPFGSMVRFMVKWSLAAIPALFILIIGATVAVDVIHFFIG